MCNCAECMEKKESRVMSVRFIGYSFLGLSTALLSKLPLGSFTPTEGYYSMMAIALLIGSAICLALPSGKILKYLNKEVEHGANTKNPGN
ncbi:MAG: hypothetical protein PHS46_08400 [Candidatus Omnitrophica bacterium]|nr:hypothetical protein [Candidatus Omnitrophota bacterium]